MNFFVRFLSLLVGFFPLVVLANCDADLKASTQNFQECKELAESGDSDALWKLALYYEQRSNSEKDSIKAFRLAERSANLGNAAGQYHLGRYYDYGIAASRNAFEAVKWYEKSALQNYLAAFNALGKVYFEGRGVRANFARAKQWFARAADKNNETGQFYIGLIGAYGSSSSKDYISAYQYLLEASENHNVDAWYYLGMMYLEGKGVDVDLDKAKYWLEKAANENHPKAILEVSEIAIQQAKKKKLVAVNNAMVETKPLPQNQTIDRFNTKISSEVNEPRESSSSSLVLSVLIAIVLGGVAVFYFRQKNTHDNEMNSRESELLRETQKEVLQSQSKASNLKENDQHSETDAANKDFYDTALLEQARKELETNQLDKNTWQHAINEANGNHVRAELLYLKFRVKQLQT
jgi:TPR repeat protein